MTKQYYRDRVKEEFAKLSQEEREKRSNRLVQKLLQDSLFQQAKTVMAYLPLWDEVQVQDIYRVKKHFCIPKIEGGNIVPVVLYENTEVDVNKMELVIVPGRAFTPTPRRGSTTRGTPFQVRGGIRIGRGLGFYDRFLAILPENILTISLAFDFQMFTDLPQEEHDVMIDKVIAEKLPFDF